MNVSFTTKQKEYIASQVREGDYQNASEVVRDALRLHEVYRHRIIDELRAEIAKGWDSPASPHNVQEILKAKLEERQM
jgi:antitoxin ParD1/3/4